MEVYWERHTGDESAPWARDPDIRNSVQRKEKRCKLLPDGGGGGVDRVCDTSGIQEDKNCASWARTNGDSCRSRDVDVYDYEEKKERSVRQCLAPRKRDSSGNVTDAPEITLTPTKPEQIVRDEACAETKEGQYLRRMDARFVISAAVPKLEAPNESIQTTTTVSEEDWDKLNKHIQVVVGEGDDRIYRFRLPGESWQKITPFP
jgi:hypothetical protein